MRKTREPRIFDTDRCIRLGIWGLGRGMSFYSTCRALNVDVVAGCDYNAHMRENFLRACPGAFATDNAEEFLRQDFDAVLLATYCPAHAGDAIKCLEAGKHVLSEVTSFHTMAEGVRLVETVEKTGLVYNLAENYPFSAANMYLARKWREGLFGELMYGEYEYVHECLWLAYTYIDGTPITRGDTVHNWRSWINYHYYNTHSLGPMMIITGTRPTRVTALPGKQRLPGYLPLGRHGMGGIAPSLINMSNGAVVRNLMGATTNDSHIQRLWGTKGSAEIVDGHLRLRLGGGGSAPKFEVIPRWDELGELAIRTGHGGGDFWVLYYFVRQILTGEPAPFDIYAACDCTIPGILAFRSQMENGKPYDVPDFRDKAVREAYRNDHYDQERYDVEKGVFPPGADYSLTKQFSLTMRDLIWHSQTYRAFREWQRVMDDMVDPSQVIALADKAIAVMPRLQEVQKVAREMIDRYPESDGATVLKALLDISDEEKIADPGFVKELQMQKRKLARRVVSIRAKRERESRKQERTSKWLSPFVGVWQLSKLVPKKGDVSKAPAVKLSQRMGWRPITAGAPSQFVNVHDVYGDRDGVVYLGQKFKVRKTGTWTLCVGHDGGVRVFLDGRSLLCEPKRVNPSVPDRSRATVRLTKGTHEIVCALDTDKGAGWGIYFRFEVPKAARTKGLKPEFPVPVENQ